jgi:YVTN family beta-propeller protein
MVGSVAIPYDPSDIVWNAKENLIYVASHNPGLTAVDCGGDSVLATVNVFDARDIELDTARNRLYVCSARPGMMEAPSYLVVVDCASQAADTAILVGSRLAQARWIPGNDVVYVADGEDPDVAVYDCATLTELARSEVGTKVSAVAWDSIDRRLYTANMCSPCISVIDGNSLTVIDTIGVSYGPFDMCWVPENNKLYCTTQRDSLIWIIDCTANQVLASLPGHDMYNDMAFSPTSNKLYCSHYTSMCQDSGLVTVIDGTTNEVITTITTGPSGTRLFWYADSNWMYCTRYRSIAVIDCETDKVITTITGVVGPYEMVFNPVNNSIYCASESGLLVIDAPARQIRKRLDIGTVYHVAWNSDKNVIYCSVAWSGELSVVDCTTDSISAVTKYKPEGYPIGILWNYLNDKVYLVLTWWENTVVVFDAATNRLIDTLTMPGGPTGIAWDTVTNRTFVPNADGSSVSVLRDDLPGIGEAGSAAARTRPVTPTVVRGILPLASKEPAALLDITGRRVMDLPGVVGSGADSGVRQYDIRHLSPGIYFIRSRTETGTMTRKVILTR